MPSRRASPPPPSPAEKPWHPYPPLPAPNHTDSECSDNEWIDSDDSSRANTDELGWASYETEPEPEELPRPPIPLGPAYQTTGEPYGWNIFLHVFQPEHLRLQELNGVYMRLFYASHREPDNASLRASRDQAKEEVEVQLARYISLFDLWGVARLSPPPRPPGESSAFGRHRR